MKKITTLFLLLFTTISFAQIKGKVTDNKGESMSFVSVYLDKTVTGTTSNDNGEYILPISKNR